MRDSKGNRYRADFRWTSATEEDRARSSRENQVLSPAPNAKRESLRLSFCILRGGVVQNTPERLLPRSKICTNTASSEAMVSPSLRQQSFALAYGEKVKTWADGYCLLQPSAVQQSCRPHQTKRIHLHGYILFIFYVFLG